MSPAIAYGAVLLGVIGHATSEFFSVLSATPGPEVSVWRFVLGAFGLLAATLAIPGNRDLLAPLRSHGRMIIWLSLFGVTVPYLAFHWALDFANIVQVGTLVTTIPIFVGIANLMVNRQRLSAPKLISAGCAVAGVALLLTDGYLAKLAGADNSLIGVLLTLVSAATISAYAVVARPLINQYGALRITALTMSIGAAVLWLLVGVIWGYWVNPAGLFDRPLAQAWPLLTLGLWNTTITQLLWLGGLAAVPDITRGSYLFFLKPVIAALLALTILAQPVSTIQFVAIAVICSAVLAEMLWPARHRQ